MELKILSNSFVYSLIPFFATMINKLTQRLEYLDSLISKKATGTPSQLAQKLGISLRAWYNLKDQLVNELDIPIEYCSFRRSYFYKNEGKLMIGFKWLSANEKETINGGCYVSTSSESSFKPSDHLNTRYILNYC